MQKVPNLMTETLKSLVPLFFFNDWSFHTTTKTEGSLFHESFIPQTAVDETLQQHRTSLYEQALHFVCVEILHHLWQYVLREVKLHLLDAIKTSKIPKNIGENDCFSCSVKEVKIPFKDFLLINH